KETVAHRLEKTAAASRNGRLEVVLTQTCQSRQCRRLVAGHHQRVSHDIEGRYDGQPARGLVLALHFLPLKSRAAVCSANALPATANASTLARRRGLALCFFPGSGLPGAAARADTPFKAHDLIGKPVPTFPDHARTRTGGRHEARRR